MANCIRCGKSANQGESMCSDCKAWFQEKTGGASVPGAAKKPVENPMNSKIQSQSQVTSQNKSAPEVVSDNPPQSDSTNGGVVPIPRKPVPNTPISNQPAANQPLPNRVPQKNNQNAGSKTNHTSSKKGLGLSGKILGMAAAAAVVLIVLLVVVVTKFAGMTNASSRSMSERFPENAENGQADVDAQEDQNASDRSSVSEKRVRSGSENTANKQANVTTEATTIAETTREKVSSYMTVIADASWSQANADAVARGGHLVTITTQEEMDRMVAYASEAGLKYVWIGGFTSIGNDGAVYGHWTTGEPFEYQMWYPGEPSGKDLDGTLESCLMLWNAEGIWSWNDQRDDVVNGSGLSYFKGKTGYIVEFEE